MAAVAETPAAHDQAPKQDQIDPAEAQGAQIPLETFTIPEFPESARSLRALTLTSDIKTAEYQQVLAQPFTIPSLPPSIESLTLELFTLGYPPNFLSTLSSRLPNLKSVVIYSQLFAGICPESQHDAVGFFKNLLNLRALHLLDVFARPHFFESAAKYLTYTPSPSAFSPSTYSTSSPTTDDNITTTTTTNSSSTKAAEETARRGLMFLEVNYTSRPSDPTFLSQIQSTEFPQLIGPGLISLSINISPPEKSDDGEAQDPTDAEHMSGQAEEGEGIMALDESLAGGMVEALTGVGRPVGLKALNLTLYTLRIDQVGEVLGVHRGIMVLSFTVAMEPGEEGKKELLTCLERCGSLEQVEVVVNPTLQFIVEVQNSRTGGKVLEETFPIEEDIVGLEKHAPRLTSFRANVLRTASFGSVEWVKKDGKWTGGVLESQKQDRNAGVYSFQLDRSQ